MPEETLELETVAQDLSDIEAEEGVDAYGSEYESETEVETAAESTEIDYEAIASRAIEEALFQSLSVKYESETEEIYSSSEEVTLSQLEIFQADSELQQIQSAPALRAGNPVMSEGKAYKLNLDGREVYAWFSGSAELSVSDDGYLYNESSNNVVGVIADTLDGLSFNSFNDTVTVAPLLTGSGNNNAYRYGSRVYVTDYYASGNSLYNTVSYISSAKVIDKPDPGYGFSKVQMVGIGLLLTLVVLVLLRGLWRDKV